MVQVFVDREMELEALEREYSKDRASLVLIYGRRRVGKTELVRKFLEGKKGVYYLADRKGYESNLRDFQREVERSLKIKDFSRIMFDGWVSLFARIVDDFPEDRIVIVIDEFPYMVEEGILSEFQKAWDLHLSKSKIFMILVGSSISMMQRITMDYGSPLYGRRTAQLKIEKMKFWDAWKFFPKYELLDFLKIYSAVDGIPHYLLQMTDEKSPEENIKDSIFRRESILYEEAEILLRMELREFKRYFSILRAIAEGKRKFSEIAGSTGLDSGSLSKYLSNLKDCGIITTDIPLLGKRKNRRYRFSDNYFHFWFKFVYPNRSMLEMGKVENVWNYIKEDFQNYLGRVFEDVIRDIFKHIYPDFTIGVWWDRKGDEIDLLAINERKKIAVCGEIKLNKKMNEKTLEALRKKAGKIRKIQDYNIKLMLCGSRIDVQEGENIMIWRCKDIENIIKEKFW